MCTGKGIKADTTDEQFKMNRLSKGQFWKYEPKP